MVLVTSDDACIERAFLKLLDTLEEAGSGFHSNLCINASAEGICLSTKEPMARGKEIIRIPRSGLMPGDQYVIKLVGDDLEIDYFVNSTLKDRQKAIIEQMFEIYNLTGKISEHKDLCFLLSLKDYPSLYEKLMKGRSYNPKYDIWFKGLQAGMSGNDYQSFLIDTFIQTRPLGYSDPVRHDSVSTIMPVIDFLNHHWEGANFHVAGGARVGDLTIAASQPLDESTECFAFYGVLDSVDSLLRYNFVDQSSSVVRSIMLELDLPDGRKILVGNKAHEPGGVLEKLPEALNDLRLYAPKFSFVEEDGRDGVEQDLSLSFLMISTPKSHAPLALRRVLVHAVRHMHEKFEKDLDFDVEKWLVDAEHKVVQENISHYEGIRQHTEDLIKEKGSSEGLLRIKLLADVQIEKLESYLEFCNGRDPSLVDIDAVSA